MSENPTASSDARVNKGQFNVVRVLAISVFVVIVFAGVFVFFGLFEGWQRIQDWGNPELVPVTGTVVFDGQPLRRGTVVTQPIDGDWKGSIGFIDESGKFSLKTDLRQGRADGAFVGKHKVAVQVQRNDPRFGASAPPSLIPEQYASFESTPFTIDVKSDGSPNHIELVIEGDETHRAEEPPMDSRPIEGERGAAEVESQSEASKEAAVENESKPSTNEATMSASEESPTESSPSAEPASQ